MAILCFFAYRIIASLSTEERAMFTERIKFLDRKIQPGLTKLTWAARSVAEFFVQDCRQLASKVRRSVFRLCVKCSARKSYCSGFRIIM